MIALDYHDKRPLYEQVTDKISQLIICGALAPGSKLPSVRSLALDLSINSNTIQRAYAQLEADGYLYSVLGRGNFVSDPEHWQEGKLSGLKDDLTKVLNSGKQAGLTKSAVLELISKVYDND